MLIQSVRIAFEEGIINFCVQRFMGLAPFLHLSWALPSPSLLPLQSPSGYPARQRGGRRVGRAAVARGDAHARGDRRRGHAADQRARRSGAVVARCTVVARRSGAP